MQNLALFDLDDTLLPLDSDSGWVRFLGTVAVVDKQAFDQGLNGFVEQYRTGTMNHVAYLEFVFAAMAAVPMQQLKVWRERFLEHFIRPALCPEAKALVARHRAAGDTVAIVTANNRFVTEPIAEMFGIEHLIAAEPEYSAHGEFTGRIVGTTPFGIGKVTLTEQWLAGLGTSLESFSRTTFYSDSHNDIPLLERVSHPVATNPNALLHAHATQRGWPVLNIF